MTHTKDYNDLKNALERCGLIAKEHGVTWLPLSRLLIWLIYNQVGNGHEVGTRLSILMESTRGGELDKLFKYWLKIPRGNKDTLALLEEIGLKSRSMSHADLMEINHSIGGVYNMDFCDKVLQYYRDGKPDVL